MHIAESRTWFDEYNYRDSLQVRAIEGIGYWPPTAQVWSPVNTFSCQIKLTLSILLLNFSRQAGDFSSNLVASSKILVAMATKMVLTWRVASTWACMH